VSLQKDREFSRELYDERNPSKALDEYIKTQSAWGVKRYREHRPYGTRFFARLHSTEEVRDKTDSSAIHSDQIRFHVFYNSRSREMLKILLAYQLSFPRRFKLLHEFDLSPMRKSNIDEVTLEYYNNRKYVDKSVAEDMARHFLAYVANRV